MTTYEDVHAGAVIIGHDGALWGVAARGINEAGLAYVTLTRHGVRITGYPPAGTPVTVVQPADVNAEIEAAQVLIDAGLGPIEIINERWEGQ